MSRGPLACSKLLPQLKDAGRTVSEELSCKRWNLLCEFSICERQELLWTLSSVDRWLLLGYSDASPSSLLQLTDTIEIIELRLFTPRIGRRAMLNTNFVNVPCYNMYICGTPVKMYKLYNIKSPNPIIFLYSIFH